MKIVTVIGARPQFIKAAAVSRELRSRHNVLEKIIHTGQHYDVNMSEIFFSEMEIPHPDFNLNINGGSHGLMTGKMLAGIEAVLIDEKPDALIVYGDTNSTLAGALAASKLHIPVAHVEAGLRSFNNKMPEEINRILTDRISNWLFCPTETAMKNLVAEGFIRFQIGMFQTGDVMQDAALYYSRRAEEKSQILNALSLQSGDFILTTIHRQENTNDNKRLVQIIKALDFINEECKVVLPMHPRTRKILANQNIKSSCTIIDPVGYFDMLSLLKHANMVITDSGGLQKEAFFFEKFCITIREETEWVELVEHGYNFIAGTQVTEIVARFQKLMNATYPKVLNLYGNGTASKSICDILVKG